MEDLNRSPTYRKLKESTRIKIVLRGLAVIQRTTLRPRGILSHTIEIRLSIVEVALSQALQEGHSLWRISKKFRLK